MRFNAKQYAKALFDSLAETSPKDLDKVLDNFTKILQENNDLRLFEEISEEFHRLELESKGIAQAHVKSAHPLSKENEKAILDELNKIAKKKIELKKEVDEKLIGGVIIQMDDQMMDLSTRGQLEQLKNNLTQ